MGKASRRKLEKSALKAEKTLWIDTLTQEEKVIARVSQAAYENIVLGLGMTEGCYNLAFFLYEHLRFKYGISVKVVIGWINDGLWAGASSHAWVEYQGKKIDISLNKTSHPEVQPSGDLIILDHIVEKGSAKYTYWESLPEASKKALDLIAEENPKLAILIKHKDVEHNRMIKLSESQVGVDEYFRSVPPNNRYEALARIVG